MLTHESRSGGRCTAEPSRRNTCLPMNLVAAVAVPPNPHGGIHANHEC
jgi:hypothetical protein